jgi:PAS domain S-box-containing protein
MVLTPLGEVLGHTDVSKRGLYPIDSISRKLLKAEPRPQLLLANKAIIDVAYPILVEEELIGWARVAVNQQAVAVGLYQISRDGVIYTLLAIVVGSIFAYWMARGLTAGLRKLVHVAEETRSGQRDLRAKLDRNDEVGQLANGVDLMLDSLQQNELALRSSENQLRRMTDILPSPVSRLDKEGRYLFVSKAYKKWFGKNPEEVVGQLQKDCIPTDVYERALPYFKKALEGHSGSFELSIPIKDGSPIQAMVHTCPDVDEDGNIQGFFIISMDLTERKQMEQEANKLREQLAQASKMEAMGQLTAGIAHDFNNILGAMLGYTELAQDAIKSPGKSHKLEHYLQQVMNASVRARELINQLLAFSRIKTETDEPPVTLLRPICKEVVSLLRSSLPSSIELEYETSDESLKSRIHGVQLHQILLNLGVNARDAIGDYGKITLHVDALELSHKSCDACHHTFSGEYVRITIKDTGSGINQDLVDKVFDPFFTTKGMGKGTGMGLSVVHGLAHTAGGHLLLESRPGKGTSIQILLPREYSHQLEKPQVAPDISPDGSQPLTDIHIMIVDDETIMANMLEEYLTLQGAETTTFYSSEKALMAFEDKSENYDIVITDETMPGLLGTHMAGRMLQIKPEIPIILCTGYSEHLNTQITQDTGIVGFFRKPVKLNELLVKLLLEKEKLEKLRE